MAAVARGNMSTSFGFAPTKISSPQSTCSVCKRFLYSFEEVLRCRVCHDVCHWRCVEPKALSACGTNDNYVCQYCNNDKKNPASYYTANDESNSRSYRTIDEDGSPREMTVGSAIQFFEKKQQKFPPTKRANKSDLDGYLPSNTSSMAHGLNGHRRNGSGTPPRKRQQYSGVRNNDDNDTSGTFQVDYEYTPLKDYAAMRNGRSTSTNDVNDGLNSSPYGQPTSRYGGGLQYTNHGYDPMVTRVVEAPLSAATDVISPTIISPRKHFISTTNVAINEEPPREEEQQQSTSFLRSSPYPSARTRDNDSPVPSRPANSRDQHLDDAPSQSGFDARPTNSRQADGNQGSKTKMTGLVRELSEQLDTDGQKLNERLEARIGNLEKMIDEQTQVIKRQEAVIAQLRNKISNNDLSRDLSSDDEPPKTSGTYSFVPQEKQSTGRQDNTGTSNYPPPKKYSDSSTTSTDTDRPVPKKAPAPRLAPQKPISSYNTERNSNALVTGTSVNGRLNTSGPSLDLPTNSTIATNSTPVREPLPASSRLSNMIRQTDSNEGNTYSAPNYNLAEVRRQDRPSAPEPISMAQQQVVTSVHRADNDDAKRIPNIQPRRSLSTGTTSSDSTSPPVKKPNLVTTTSSTSPKLNTQQNVEPLPSPSPSNRQQNYYSTSTTLGPDPRPIQPASSGSIYLTPEEANEPAIQASSSMKGWLRKQNRDSFFKRIERYYCTLVHNALLLHRNENDKTPVKSVSLKGAKLLYTEDSKHGPSLELRWTTGTNDTKHYHFYVETQAEADRWVDAIQTTIHSLEAKNQWSAYRLND